jgi:hypothetical protein
LGFDLGVEVLGFGFGVQALGSELKVFGGLGFVVWCLGCTVWVFGVRVRIVGFGLCNFKLVGSQS